MGNAIRKTAIITGFVAVVLGACQGPEDNTDVRKTEKFTSDWRFMHADLLDQAGDATTGDPPFSEPDFDDQLWTLLDLPHDWSISEPYHIDNPGRFGTSFMIGGVGWYRKSFFVPEADKGKRIEIMFDGVYQNSTIWVNGHELGTRPFGYITFKYDLTPYLNYGAKNVIAVKVDNAAQPNSRWYSGSGIYRHVWLTTTGKVYVDPWGVFITTPEEDKSKGGVSLSAVVRNDLAGIQQLHVGVGIFSSKGRKVASSGKSLTVSGMSEAHVEQLVEVPDVRLWDVDSPELYEARVTLHDASGKLLDAYSVRFGFRYFHFDPTKGFILNGRQLKIRGVCMHHDLGALGAAVNVRAMERQLEILRGMGVNAIRTAHNPPAPELLNLCDEMGFMVMNETFDAWAMRKTDYDYSVFWEEWHEQDLRDHILRDRNHPSVFIWSIGNEILEQWQPQGEEMTAKLVDIVKSLDSTRPVTAGNNHASPGNSLIASGKLDLIGYNYKHEAYADFHEVFPGESFIAAETTSGLATRGSYDMPSDSIRRWPYRWDIRFTDGNPDHSCSSYDNCHAPWGSTHGDTWKVVKKHDFLSGMFIWTGFDYLGEPTPYEWPSRSSYFGIVDLAGFPKDAYYMYQSEWTDKTVLHLFPHWNWEPGKEVDVWAYYNQADEVELFLNGVSLGIKRKAGDDLHVQWRVPYEPGSLKAVSRKNGSIVATKEIHTAGKPAAMRVDADRTTIRAGGEDLSFITIDIVDDQGTLVPHGSNLVEISIIGDASIAGVDNGSQTSHEPFQANRVFAFHGKCLVIIRSGKNAGNATVSFRSEGLQGDSIQLDMH